MDNTGKFTNKADNYVKYRPSYPQEFIEYLSTEVGFGKGSVLASETGNVITVYSITTGCFHWKNTSEEAFRPRTPLLRATPIIMLLLKALQGSLKNTVRIEGC
jgi:hypothetical protein